MHVRNPVEWSVDQLKHAGATIDTIGQGRHLREAEAHPLPVQRIGVGDLREALVRGVDDFLALRSDVVFLCLFYPVIGFILARLVFGYGLLPLLFPLASGFALIGPVAAVGLYEMSRRRETGWGDAFKVVRNPGFGSILLFGLMLLAIFLCWLIVALLIYDVTLGPQPPASAATFVHDLTTTGAGWTLIGAGIGVGFLFAVLVLAIGVVSAPLMLDREIGVVGAMWTSLRAVAASPGTMALWGLIVAVALVLGSLPVFLGLIVVMPVLGHATWHLYRRVVEPSI
jgi:uncharacterized membrane protein